MTGVHHKGELYFKEKEPFQAHIVPFYIKLLKGEIKYWKSFS